MWSLKVLLKKHSPFYKRYEKTTTKSGLRQIKIDIPNSF